MKLFRKPVNLLIGLMVIFIVLVIEIAQASAAANFTQLTDLIQPRRIAVDVSGNLYLTSFNNYNIKKINPAGVWLAPLGGFNATMSCVAVDSSSNVYISDRKNNRVHKFTATGVWVTTWGGYGTGNGQFNYPRGIAVDSSGNVYVADSQNNRIQKFASSGAWVATWGKTDCSSGTLNGQFNGPCGITIDSSGNVYVADSFNHRIQKFESNGNWLATWGKTGCSSGNASGEFYEPRGVALDSSGNVYVADSGNNRIQKLNLDTWEIWGGYGTDNAKFKQPVGIAVDIGGNVYVADTGNNRIQKFTSAGSFETKWGSTLATGLTIDNGNVYVVEAGRIQKYTATGTNIGMVGNYDIDDGHLINPVGLTVDSEYNVYIIDNEKKILQKFNNAGEYLTKFGYEDGTLVSPYDVALDNSNNFYIVEIGNRIQKRSSTWDSLMTWGGYGTNPGQFNEPVCIAVYDNYAYITDNMNNRIQQLDIEYNTWKTWGGYGKGHGQFYRPVGIAVDIGGNVYVADSENNRVQMFDSNGNYKVMWGKTDCTAGSAPGQFNITNGIAVDRSGNVYVGDKNNNRIQVLLAPALKASSTIKGQPVGAGLGTPSILLGSASAGSVTITAVQAVGSTGTLFDNSDTSAGATVTVVKYASGSDPSHFETDAPYQDTDVITNGDCLVVKLTEEVTTRSSYYKINVTVSAPAKPVIEPITAGSGHVSLSWNAVPGAAGYKIYRSTAAGSYGAALATVNEPVHSYDVTGLANGTTYYFVVKSFNSGGDSEASTEVSATPQVAAPGKPVLQTVTAGSGHVYLSWSAVPGAAGYKVYQSSASGSYGAERETVGGSVYSYDATELINGNTYYFMVRATNPGGDSMASNELSAIPQVAAPGAPVLQPPTAGDAHVNLNWAPVTGSGGYKIYQSTASGSYGAERETVGGSVYSYDATGLINGIAYYFVVMSTNPGGDSGASNEVSAIPQVAAPGAPVLQPPVAGDAHVNLNWVPVAGATGFKIYQSTASGSYGAERETVGGSVYSYDATGLINGTAYYFMVRATNPGGDSMPSIELSATPQVAAPGAPVLQPPTSGDAHVNLNWAPVTGSTGYKIYQSTASGSYGAERETVGGSVCSYDATGLINGTEYYFVVKSANPGGDSGASNEVSAIPQMAVPGELVLQPPVAGDAHVNLNWVPVAGATGYKIYQSTTSGSYGAERETVGGSVYSYNATGLSNGTTYYFVVTAMNPGGDSGYSNEVSATPNPPAAHAVSVAANPTAGGSVSGGGTCNEGSSVTITATPCSGYYFVNWTENNVQVSTNPSYTFVMGDSVRTLVANFSLISSSDRGDHDSTTSIQPINSTTGTALINPAVGGTVSLGSDTSLKIPANALRGIDYMKVTVEKVDTPSPAPSGFAIAGAVYRFTVNDQDHYDFNRLVRLTFTFDPSQLAPGQTPAVYYYEEAEGKWVNIGGTVSGNTITVNVDHFTKYAVMVEQSISPMQKPPVALTDIAGHWAEANINELVAMGAISGNPDGTFKPDNTITRAEFATVLVKAFKLEQKSGHLFNDTSDHWAKEFIATAAANGIINGYDRNTFGPDDPVTREQMAVMIVKAARLELGNEETVFRDSGSISDWANSAVATVVKNGIMKGYVDNTFKPQDNASRAEAVTVIVNTLNK